MDFFSNKTKINNTSCCVPGCKSKVSSQNKNIRFHLFPKLGKRNIWFTNKSGETEWVDARKAWEVNLRIGKKVSNYMRVCSLHFQDSDYFNREMGNKKKHFLKLNVIPSLNLPNEPGTYIGINNNHCPKARTEQYSDICNTKPVENKRNLQTQDSSSSHTNKILSGAAGLKGCFTIVDINDIMKRTSEPQQDIINLTQKSTVISSKSGVIVSSDRSCSKTESVSKMRSILKSSSTVTSKSDTTNNDRNCEKTVGVAKLQSILKPSSTVTSSKSDIINIDENYKKTEGISKTQPLHNMSFTTSLNLNSNNNIVVKENKQFPLSTETLSSLLNSLPRLQYNQCYLINLPNKAQLLVKPTTVANTYVLPNNQPTLKTSKEQPSMPLHNKSDKTHLGSTKKPKEIKSTNPNPYRCVEIKKSNFKIDSDGFTYFDRLGFFKAEERRSRRCVSMLNLHIEVRDELLSRLVEENESKRIAKLSNKQIKKNNHKIRKTKNKLHIGPSSPTNKETVDIKQHKKYVKKYKLKDCSIVLSKQEVREYLVKKGKNLKRGSPIKTNRLPPNKYLVSNLKFPVYNNNSVSLEELFVAASDSLITFIDDNNFELALNHLLSEKVYFINSHEIVTELYTDIFPVFLFAVQSNLIRVVEKEIFNKFLAASTDKYKTLAHLKTSNREKDRIQDKDKLNAFCDFVIDFHAVQKKSQCESTIICTEHNYSLKKKV